MMVKEDIIQVDVCCFFDECGLLVFVVLNGFNFVMIMEKVVKDCIVDFYFYKEQCFVFNEVDIIDCVVEYVNFIGGMYGGSQKLSFFFCFVFKFFEFGFSDVIFEEYLGYGGEYFKYLWVLVCFYFWLMRLVKDVYKRLEFFLVD